MKLSATADAVAKYSEDGTLPARMTLRFLALCKKKELATLARHYHRMMHAKALPEVLSRSDRFYETRYNRIQSERRQRGHISS